MTTITIPRQLTKEKDLVVITRKEYEQFLRLENKTKRKNIELDNDLEVAMKQVSEGKIIGPFNSIRGLKKSLEK